MTYFPGVDMYPLYPESIRPKFMYDLRKWYIETYNDQFFVNPPAWFLAYMWMELFYHIPLSAWAIGALLRGMCTIFQYSLSGIGAYDRKHR